MRVVFDTNIFISAFAIPGGNAEEAYLHAVRGRFVLFTSFFILTETANILRTKFDWTDEKVEQLLTSISKTATVLKTQPHLHILTDEPDNRILECALLAEAKIIVSGDRHLLSLVCHEEIRILTLAGFLDDLHHS
ncbi:putative toxin-antitoxin system toxin component, PIN family [Candidatus Methylomirabilis limnetica]|uniref:Putative toxin-antitoxin system toxin component, PIN family n=1 Tax=Candidatus Methylomirabilis limnetica TaxID=2033718 RepID=A0A2T4U0J9_9BACT|nr:putative toxin-antitoxin system toxin component, PIN family [Candidatus Methylomirabilis limnetica]PTL36848.1 putative toxin-antitoxin system toxin component, PIN family [Candidatus Methylomirabilis limnetica]